ncbi:CotG/ExsB N-terminal domain-containing protein [Ectobacillus sp. sgz5001026]|uniref:CotG/ExsB N-terminal domain-containing protein n=1 Tax=Ectobacillus sp. sgz5001026 TaxID=3242473 RepID=UPI0036D3EF3E
MNRNIRKAVDEVIAAGMEDFLHQEPSSHFHSKSKCSSSCPKTRCTRVKKCIYVTKCTKFTKKYYWTKKSYCAKRSFIKKRSCQKKCQSKQSHLSKKSPKQPHFSMTSSKKRTKQGNKKHK